MELKKNQGVMSGPKKKAVIKEVEEPEEKRYTLFIWFLDNAEREEKTFEFITGQANARQYIIDNADIIDFDQSLISNWKEAPETENGFIYILDFMHYLEKLVYEDNNEPVYDDGFVIDDFLDSLHEVSTITSEEYELYQNNNNIAMQDSKMIDDTEDI